MSLYKIEVSASVDVEVVVWADSEQRAERIAQRKAHMVLRDAIWDSDIGIARPLRVIAEIPEDWESRKPLGDDAPPGTVAEILAAQSPTLADLEAAGQKRLPGIAERGR